MAATASNPFMKVGNHPRSRLIIELKAAKSLSDEHTAQLLGYLRACRIELGLLINFCAPRFAIRKFALSEASVDRSPSKLVGLLLSLFAPLALFRG